MNTKGFTLLLVGVLVLGASLGGVFAGGVALGKSQGKEAAASAPPAQSSSGPSGQTADQFDLEQLSQLREQLQSGELDPEALEQLRQQFQGGGGSLGGRSFGGRGGGLSGAIEAIMGNAVTVATSQGPLSVTVGTETTIQRFASGTLADLGAGMQVTVIGQRGEDGTVLAQSIVIIPEGSSGLFGGGGFSR